MGQADSPFSTNAYVGGCSFPIVVALSLSLPSVMVRPMPSSAARVPSWPSRGCTYSFTHHTSGFKKYTGMWPTSARSTPAAAYPVGRRLRGAGRRSPAGPGRARKSVGGECKEGKGRGGGDRGRIQSRESLKHYTASIFFPNYGRMRVMIQ